jgi:hypothetical protein
LEGSLVREVARLITAAAALTLTVGVSPAVAATPFTVGQGERVEVIVGADGRGHVVWNIPSRAGAPAKIGYCRLPAGASACDITRELDFPAAPSGVARSVEVTLFAPTASRIVVVGACFVCADATANDKVVRWTSTDGGATFPAPEVMGAAPVISRGIQPSGVWLDAEGLFVTPAGGNTALVAAPVTAVPVVGAGFVYTPSIVRAPGTSKLVHAASDLSVVQYAVHTGPALTAASIGTAASWSTGLGLSSPEGGSSETQLNSGPSGVSLTYRHFVPNDDRIVLRRFDANANAFGGPTEIQGSAAVDNSAEYPDSSQDAGGRVHVAWLSRDAGNQLRYTRSDTDGANFTAPASIAQGELFNDPDVAAGPDGQGWAAWQGIGDTPIRVVRIEPAAKPGTVFADPVSGTVLIRRPGSSRFQALRNFDSIPRGTVIDVAKGRIALRSTQPAAKQAAAAPAGEFYGGAFALTRPGTSKSPPSLTLFGEDSCRARGAARKKPPRKRRLWGDAKGRFETRGRYGSAINSGTLWLTEDSCDRTLFRVVRGSISARGAGQRAVKVSAGQTRAFRRRP